MTNIISETIAMLANELLTMKAFIWALEDPADASAAFPSVKTTTSGPCVDAVKSSSFPSVNEFEDHLPEYITGVGMGHTVGIQMLVAFSFSICRRTAAEPIPRIVVFALG